MSAGLGYIEFATGDVLTAASANGYLASQVVMVFASASARTTAITSPQEGMMSYLKDTNAVEAYDGSAWISIGATGDITSVTAGTGLSGGGTSGAVTLAIDTTVTADLSTAQTLTNKTLTSPVLTTPSISNIDAKGDLLAGTADNTIGRLAVGSNGQVLTADSAEATGLKWATAASGGGMTLISSGSMSGSSVSVSVPSGYVNVMWIVQGATLSSADQIFFRINGNSAGVYQSSFTTRQGTGAGQNYVSYTNNASQLLIDGTCTSGSDINFVFQVFNVDTTGQHAFNVASNWVSGLGESQQNWVGKYSATGAITSLSVSRYGGSATFNAGTYYLYGIK